MHREPGLRPWRTLASALAIAALAVAAGLPGATAATPLLAESPADGSAPPQGAAPAPPAAAEPGAAAKPAIEPSHLAAARDLVVVSGLSRLFEPVIVELRDQIPGVVGRTRPDLAKDLNDVLAELTPEFDAKKNEIVDLAAEIYARSMTEDELRQAADFFRSPVGRKYLDSQPHMLNEVVVAMQAWTQRLSTYMMRRAREEMIRRGHPF